MVPFRPSSALTFFVAPVVLILLAHYLIVVMFDLNTLVLRLATLTIPFVFGFILYRQARHGPVWALLLGAGIGVVSVIGMLSSVALVDTAPIIPSARREWQEAIEYLAGIALATVAGNLLARATQSMMASGPQ